MAKQGWTLTHCDCGKPAVAHGSDNEHEFAKCAECFPAFHKQHADETRAIVRERLGR